jgi:hypothetical protein
MELETDVSNRIKSWSRLDLIEWLCWNDRNEFYKDDESLQEFGIQLVKKKLLNITRQ